MRPSLFFMICSVVALFELPDLFLEAKKIVMFPFPWRSYAIYHSIIAAALAEFGHDVWLCLPRQQSLEGLVRNERVRFITYEYEFDPFYKKLFAEELLKKDHDSVYEVFQPKHRHEIFLGQILEDTQFISSVTNLKPDLFVLEMVKSSTNVVLIPYKYDIPFAFISTMPNPVKTRTPFNPILEPLIHLSVSDKMTFFQRVKLTLIYLTFLLCPSATSDKFVRQFVPEKPFLSINDIVLKAEIFLFETDHILDYHRPALPNTKFIGSSSARPANSLTGALKLFAHESSHGFAVVSFGSVDVDLGQRISDTVMSAFEKIALNVVWKTNATIIHSRKILTRPWLPQNDLLGHPNAKVFISQCGKNGQYEALYHAVPILCLPLHSDQFYNTERILVKGFGLGADLRSVTPEELANLINNVTYDPRYRSNIKKASKLFKELYRNSSKEAAFWFDHVMKYGGDYMRSPGQQMPLYQYLLIDVIAFLMVSFIVTILVMYTTIRLIYYMFKNNAWKLKSE